MGFPCVSARNESACNVGHLGSVPGLGRSPGEGKGYPLQYSGLENSMDCIVHRVAKSQTRAACWAGAPWGGERGSCVLQVCVLPRGSWVPGLDNPGRGQWASRVRFGSSPCTWSCTHVALCPACYPGWECRLHIWWMTRSLVECVRSPELSEFREPRGMGSPLTFPLESDGMYEARVPQPDSPSCEVHRSSARVSHLGSNSLGRQRAR